ncbi:YbjN domain-containing protein [Natronoglycomyces albus]|uniref:YbjN domain-containing protein n=1 Tax=Natronoglycomyces albus TaxID=2811108 RepID=A0A895XKU5_9ACTN|nr:YbjN domain-containing protein [Natronoglycomyces albus]QSB05687.1 YbjN domain-containing protein [Natronoglycomyces albus]
MNTEHRNTRALADQLDVILRSMDVDYTKNDAGLLFTVSIPGERRKTIDVTLVVEDHALKVLSFVARCPEERHQQVWEELLRRNFELFSVAFTIDDRDHDIYLVGRVSHSSVNEHDIDRLLGVVHQATDGVFNRILELGFESSIRQEWRWRLDRGESTVNLQAFEQFKPRD